MAFAAVLDGIRRTDTARIGGMDRQTPQNWGRRFNAADPDGLLDRSPGPPSRLSPERRADLAAIVEKGPDRAVKVVRRWRRVDPRRIIWSACTKPTLPGGPRLQHSGGPDAVQALEQRWPERGTQRQAASHPGQRSGEV